MSSNWFGLVEGLLIVALAVAFYVWQMKTLNRDIRAREDREARERAARSDAAAPPLPTGHPVRDHHSDDV